MIQKLKKIFINIIIFLPLFIFIFEFLGFKYIDYIWWFIILTGGYIGIIDLIKRVINKNINYNIIEILLFIYFLIVILFSLFNYNEIVLIGNKYRHDGIITFISYIGYFHLLSNIEEKEISKYLKYFILISSILSLICLLDNIFNLYLNFNQYKYSSIFYNPNHFAYYLTLSLLLSIGLFINNNNIRDNIILILEFIIMLITFILNNTFGSYLGFIVGLIIFLIYGIRKKIYKIFIVLVITLLLSVTITNSNNKIIVINNFKNLVSDINILNNTNIDTSQKYRVGNRYILWKYGIKMIKEKPLIGYGLDNLYNKYISYDIYEDRPHNEFIQIAATSGILSLFIYLLILFKLIINNKNNNLIIVIKICIIGYLISSFFGNTMFYTTIYFFIFLGILYNLELKYIKSK